MKYADLLKKYRDGTIEATDLDGVDTKDWMSVRLEAGEGLLHCALSDAAFQDKKGKDDKGKSKSYGYVMVSDGLIPPFQDKVLSNAWDTKEFKYRGSNVLYDHNIEEARPPIGKASNLSKGVEMKRGGQSFKALTGDVTFADRSMYAFAGLVEDLVDAKMLTNGSVGFDIVKMRAPSEEEQEEFGMRSYSAIIQKANLIEFSITPLGRDKNAQRLSDEALGGLQAKLAEFAEAGVHDESVIGEFREGLLSMNGGSTTFMVQRPELPEVVPSDEPEEHVVAGEPATFSFTTNGDQSLYAESTTTNSSEFDITLPEQQVFTGSSTSGQYVSFADSKARSEIEQLRAEIAELREEVQRLSASNDDDVEADLYDLIFADDDSTSNDSDADGDATESDLYTLAEDLGFTP